MKSYNSEDWIKRLGSDLPADYQIGLHQIGVYGTEESRMEVRKNNIFTYLRPIKPRDFCKSIMKSGLKNRWESLGFTLTYFGSVSDIINNRGGYKKERFLDYEYERSTVEEEKQDLYNVVIAIPSHIVMDGKQYFMGELPSPEFSIGKETELERMESIFKQRDVPPEFVYRIYS